MYGRILEVEAEAEADEVEEGDKERESIVDLLEP